MLKCWNTLAWFNLNLEFVKAQVPKCLNLQYFNNVMLKLALLWNKVIINMLHAWMRCILLHSDNFLLLWNCEWHVSLKSPMWLCKTILHNFLNGSQKRSLILRANLHSTCVEDFNIQHNSLSVKLELSIKCSYQALGN